MVEIGSPELASVLVQLYPQLRSATGVDKFYVNKSVSLNSFLQGCGGSFGTQVYCHGMRTLAKPVDNFAHVTSLNLNCETRMILSFEATVIRWIVWVFAPALNLRNLAKPRPLSIPFGYGLLSTFRGDYDHLL